MKKIFLSFLVLFTSTGILVAQQGQTYPPLDKSPMDMSYFPNNFPLLKIQGKATEPLTARIIYSRPQKSGRTIFGELVEYGKVWRMGANEATELELFKHARIGDKKIPKGRYTLYAIPYENKWTIIINKETDIWGAFKYDPKKDLVRLDVPVEKNNETTEALAMTFEKRPDGANLIIAWDNVRVALPIIF
ncbi:MAG TPA: DUF2911 domain-containing protein [Chitinophagaceae bacterium]|nr:DUF2911 domain-containing protein [Chitinophagaceae bacterium]